MKTALRLFFLLALFSTAARAADDAIIAAVRAADDARMAATQAANARRLGEIFSDELHYAHSSGRIDNKASQIALITSGTTQYQEFQHRERTYTVAGPGVVLSKGRVIIRMASKTGGAFTNDLNYLAVWRNENGTWRFLAWQSCKNPDATAKK